MLHFKKGCNTIIKSKNKLYRIGHYENLFQIILKRKSVKLRSNLLKVLSNLKYITYIDKNLSKPLIYILNDVNLITNSISLIDKICSYCISLKNYGKRIVLKFHLICAFRRNTEFQKVFCLRSNYL